MRLTTSWLRLASATSLLALLAGVSAAHGEDGYFTRLLKGTTAAMPRHDGAAPTTQPKAAAAQPSLPATARAVAPAPIPVSAKDKATAASDAASATHLPVVGQRTGAAAASAAAEPAWDDITAAIPPEQPLVPTDWSPNPAGSPAIEKPVPFEALPAVNAGVKAVLDKTATIPLRGSGAGEKRRQREAVAFFYAARNFQPLWSDNGQPLVAVPGLLAQLTRAGDDGLDLADVPVGLAVDGTPAAIGASDVALTAAVVAYARQATGARVDPRTIGSLIGLHPTLAEPAETLEKLVAAGPDSAKTLQALNPIEPRYQALRDKLMTMRVASKTKPKTALKSAADAFAFPPGPSLRIGMRDARVPLLRARFHIDDLGENVSNPRYDEAVADAIAAFQRDNDLPATGVLTRATVAALSGETPEPVAVPRSNARATILANMEMWRWMPHELAANRVEVNIPDFQVTVFHDGHPSEPHRVVVGKTDTPTPLFSNAVKYLIVNPYWNVPQSIIRKEMLPKGGGDLSYLEGRGYSVSSRGGQWVVKQLPGEKNALGRIKFLFPNDYAVYLHDTPSKALFASKARAFSHGCVRVDQPFAFAETLLDGATVTGAHQRWNAERLEGLIGDKEHYINLATPLPIHIEYFTVTVDAESHALRIRDDVYGYAGQVAAALGLAPDALVAERKPRVVAEQVRHRPKRAAAEDTGFAGPDDADPR